MRKEKYGGLGPKNGRTHQIVEGGQQGEVAHSMPDEIARGCGAKIGKANGQIRVVEIAPGPCGYLDRECQMGGCGP